MDNRYCFLDSKICVLSLPHIGMLVLACKRRKNAKSSVSLIMPRKNLALTSSLKWRFPPQYLEWMARQTLPPMGEQPAPWRWRSGKGLFYFIIILEKKCIRVAPDWGIDMWSMVLVSVRQALSAYFGTCEEKKIAKHNFPLLFLFQTNSGENTAGECLQ